MGSPLTLHRPEHDTHEKPTAKAFDAEAWARERIEAAPEGTLMERQKYFRNIHRQLLAYRRAS